MKNEIIPILPLDTGRYYRMMHQQKKEYLRYLILGENTFVIQFELHFEDLHKDSLETAVDWLFDRHESLRTAFRLYEGEMRQYIYASKPPGFRIAYIDLVDCDNQEEIIEEIYRTTSAISFDFEKGPLVDIRVVHYAQKLSGLLFTMHHVISDARSVEILKKDILILYEACRKGEANPLPLPRLQYKEYGFWINDLLEGSVGEGCRLYYKKKILESLSGGARSSSILRPSYRKELETDLWTKMGADGVSCLPEAYGKIVNLCPIPGGSFRAYVNEVLLNKLEKMAMEYNTTLFAVLVSTFAILLRKVNKWDAHRFYIPVTTRVEEEFEDIVGWLIGDLIVCVDLNEDLSCKDFVMEVTDNILETGNYRYYPYEWIMRDLDLPLNILAPVFINMETSLDETIHDFVPSHRESGSGHFGLKIVIGQHKNGLALTVDYNLKVYTPSEIEHMMGEYLVILESDLFEPQYTLKHFFDLWGN